MKTRMNKMAGINLQYIKLCSAACKFESALLTRRPLQTPENLVHISEKLAEVLNRQIHWMSKFDKISLDYKVDCFKFIVKAILLGDVTQIQASDIEDIKIMTVLFDTLRECVVM